MISIVLRDMMQNVLPPQETFESGLTTFQQEGIGSLAAMKDRLLAAQHPQSKQLQHRHADVIRRWGVGGMGLEWDINDGMGYNINAAGGKSYRKTLRPTKRDY